MSYRDPYVFIVDDNKLNLEILSITIARKLKCKIKRFHNAEDCLAYTKMYKPKAIVTDYYLDEKGVSGKMNGGDLEKKVSKEIPVIVYSESSNSDIANALTRNDKSNYLSKDENFYERITDILKNELYKSSGSALRTVCFILGVLSFTIAFYLGFKEGLYFMSILTFSIFSLLLTFFNLNKIMNH